jgi:hypothetical protein
MCIRVPTPEETWSKSGILPSADLDISVFMFQIPLNEFWDASLYIKTYNSLSSSFNNKSVSSIHHEVVFKIAQYSRTWRCQCKKYNRLALFWQM